VLFGTQRKLERLLVTEEREVRAIARRERATQRHLERHDIGVGARCSEERHHWLLVEPRRAAVREAVELSIGLEA
jgi:hypothetical protein